ncbi:hypothetical protein [Rhodoferax sp.]|uniref:hypothetical protein n=1 Tax=Rhodoferax sp. TaxID=50421 RepID=UPI00274BD8FE|nr:hypothetical protein [Rhodoferax sp.]
MNQITFQQTLPAMRQYHVGIAAEAFAAAVFAQSGCDVLVQYGANQPGYDLMVSIPSSWRFNAIRLNKFLPPGQDHA